MTLDIRYWLEVGILRELVERVGTSAKCEDEWQ